MSSPRAILLVPAAGDPHGLLATGACGARPPLAYYFPGSKTWNALDDMSRRWRGSRPSELEPHALVLVWGSVVIQEGCDRAARVLASREGLDAGDVPPNLVESKNGDCFVLWGSKAGKVENTYYGKNAVPFGCAGDCAVIRWQAIPVPPELRYALNLATVCAARLIGEAVVLS